MNSLRLLTLGLLATCALFPAQAPAQPLPGNALALLDAYLSQAAADTPRFRADLQPGTLPAGTASGRRSGQGPILGLFTYRPKTYRELSPEERSDLLRDPALRAYLARAGPAPAPAPPPPAPLPAARRFVLAPEEMLRPRPFEFALPAP